MHVLLSAPGGAEYAVPSGFFPPHPRAKVAALMLNKDGSPAGQGAPAPAVALSMRGVSKHFMVPAEPVKTLKERVLRPGSSRIKQFQVLSDIDFAVQPGEFYGIVGRNGSGKSTLLKCMAGIYRPDTGDVTVNGRLATFIELGVGFNPDLSARDNVVLNATLLGLSPDEAHARFDDIIEFSGLREFVDLKLRNYSSGMHVRLAFAVAINVDADVLLIDEVLAVGDMDFQQKCFAAFEEIKASGRTVIFVSHDMAMVERFCDRAMLIEHGKIVDIGDPGDVAQLYAQVNSQHAGQEVRTTASGRPRTGDGSAEIVETWLENDSGERIVELAQGEYGTLKYRCRFNRDMINPVFGVTIQDDSHHAIFGANTRADGIATGNFKAGESAVYSVRFSNLIERGVVYVNPAVFSDIGMVVADSVERDLKLDILGPRVPHGLVNLPHTASVER
jgi:ABC-type polysaccharide/polyol phosphate transport system ATPase subunit